MLAITNCRPVAGTISAPAVAVVTITAELIDRITQLHTFLTNNKCSLVQTYQPFCVEWLIDDESPNELDLTEVTMSITPDTFWFTVVDNSQPDLRTGKLCISEIVQAHSYGKEIVFEDLQAERDYYQLVSN